MSNPMSLLISALVVAQYPRTVTLVMLYVKTMVEAMFDVYLDDDAMKFDVDDYDDHESHDHDDDDQMRPYEKPNSMVYAYVPVMVACSAYDNPLCRTEGKDNQGSFDKFMSY